MRRAAVCAVLAVGWFALAAAAPAADLTVGASSSLDLGTGQLDLGCADLTVAGTLSAGSVGFAAARDVAISPSGIVNGNSATLEVSGNWDNAGTFNAGTSTVRLVDGCGLLSADIFGNSSFASLVLTSASAKLFQFEAGKTTTVGLALTLQGAMGSLLKLRSTFGGSEAFLNLAGSQSVNYVDVRDNHATGNAIVLPPNSIKGTNSTNWNLAAAVPSLGVLGMAGLVLALLWIASRSLAARRVGSPYTPA